MVMRVLFWVPLSLIAVFEATLDPRKNSFTHAWFEANEEEDEDDPEYQDPEVDEEDGKITKVTFKELIKDFPNTSQVCLSLIYGNRSILMLPETRAWKPPLSMRYRLCRSASMSSLLLSEKAVKSAGHFTEHWLFANRVLILSLKYIRDIYLAGPCALLEAGYF